jgi:hypothetical protein
LHDTKHTLTYVLTSESESELLLLLEFSSSELEELDDSDPLSASLLLSCNHGDEVIVRLVFIHAAPAGTLHYKEKNFSFIDVTFYCKKISFKIIKYLTLCN